MTNSSRKGSKLCPAKMNHYCAGSPHSPIPVDLSNPRISISRYYLLPFSLGFHATSCRCSMSRRVYAMAVLLPAHA